MRILETFRTLLITSLHCALFWSIFHLIQDRLRKYFNYKIIHFSLCGQKSKHKLMKDHQRVCQWRNVLKWMLLCCVAVCVCYVRVNYVAVCVMLELCCVAVCVLCWLGSSWRETAAAHRVWGGGRRHSAIAAVPPGCANIIEIIAAHFA